MMIDRLAGNAALKDSVRLMLGSSRLTHSVLLVGETGLGAGYAARCVAADYLYPAGGAPAEALLRGECCRAVGKAGDRDSGRIETGVVRGGHLRHRHGLGRAVSRQSGQGHAHRNFQYQPLRRGPRRPALPCGADERGIRQRPAEGDGGAAGRRALPADGRFAGRCAAHHPQPLHQLRRGPGQPRGMRPVVHRAGRGQKAGPALQ